MTTDSLKPCPFCGKPGAVSEAYETPVRMTYHVGCSNQNCIVYELLEVDEENISYGVKDWNKRALPKGLPSERPWSEQEYD